MNAKLQPVRGTQDILPENSRTYRAIVETARAIGELYNFEEIATPIFEFTEIFKRTLGDSSDVVNKEMYSFEDRGGESITLRPEFTAGIARAFISNGLQQNLPLKLFSHGPLFRYERPQKGRQRQFHQINFEWLGNKNPIADVELIALANDVVTKLGITEGLNLELNSLGDTESRDNYRNALVKYIECFKDKLSEDSLTRLEKNPLRILDSKDEQDKEIIANAPVIEEYFSAHAKEFFDQVKDGLNELGINYNVNPQIVRGLDYYCHTVFEFKVDSSELGAQNAIIAGGRYDGLISQMGGPETPACGFAAGMERLVLVAKLAAEKTAPIAILTESSDLELTALKIAGKLRAQNLSSELFFGSNFGKCMKKANKAGAETIVIVRDGDVEVKSESDIGNKVREIIN